MAIFDESSRHSPRMEVRTNEVLEVPNSRRPQQARLSARGEWRFWTPGVLTSARLLDLLSGPDSVTTRKPRADPRPADSMERTTRIAETASLLLDFSHSRQALLSVAQPALGALLAGQGYPDRRTLILGLPAATAGMLCVYASNDLFDLRADREEARWLPSAQGEDRYDIDVMKVRHPLAQGALSTPLGTAWVSGTGLLALLLATGLRRGCGLIFVGCVGLEAIYCGLRRRTWLKTIPGGSMVGLGALAGWYAVGEMDRDAFKFFLLLTFWEIFGRNVSNDLADLSLDDRVGICTIASTHGPTWAARTCLGGATAMLAVAALQRGPLPLRLILAAAVAATMTVPAMKLVRKSDSRQAQRYFNRASLFPPLAFAAAAAFFLLSRPSRLS